ncbi:MAG: M50 family metallopeptidase [Lachnospiraceae bacterium]|nr:M50 family metallopeptidase [Lachnospiraceae bacterium]
MSIIIALIIFCVVVVIHEMGHMLVAKANGIYVKEFWVGFGPTILSFVKGETKYCIKPIPLGGACVFEEDALEEGQLPSERAFNRAGVFARILTVAAGPIANFILAFVFSIVVLGLAGYSPSVINEVKEGSPAYEAGLRVGDRIVKMDHENIHLYDEVLLNLIFNRGEEIRVTYEREGERRAVDITPELDPEKGRYMLGISGGKKAEDQTLISTVQYSFYYTNYWVKNVLKSLLSLVRGRVKVNELSGVVGLTATVNDIYQESKSHGVLSVFINMMNIAVLLSANLGVFNLLPIPALDGGRLLFFLVEVFRRKPADQELEAKIHFAGFALLMLLTVFIMYNDILKLFK